MKLHRYENFINEGKAKFGPSKLGQVNRKIGLRKGECVIITTDVVDPKKDIDFSRTAKSWWGKNVYSLKNEFKSDFIWHKGDIIMISDGGDKGYVGGGNPDDNIWYMSPYRLDISRENEEYRREMIDILVNQGMAEVVNYEVLSEDFRKKWESDIKDDRISTSSRKDLSVSGETIGLEDNWYKVIEYKWLNKNRDNGSKLKVVVDKKIVDFVLSNDEISNGKFLSNGNEITNDPFDGFDLLHKSRNNNSIQSSSDMDVSQ